jgi:hypothetical protein
MGKTCSRYYQVRGKHAIEKILLICCGRKKLVQFKHLICCISCELMGASVKYSEPKYLNLASNWKMKNQKINNWVYEQANQQKILIGQYLFIHQVVNQTMMVDHLI